MRAAAVADDEDVVVEIGRFEVRARQRTQAELAKWQDEPESGHLIVSKRVTGNDRARMRRQPDRFGFGDQVTDRQHEAVVVDDDAIAGPFGPEDRCGERVLGDLDADGDDRIKCDGEVERNLAALRLQLGGEGPVGLIGHVSSVASADAGRSYYANGAPRET